MAEEDPPMSLEKVAIKNERPGIMLEPALRPPGENHAVTSVEAREVEADEELTPSLA
jgi:hypothetical protein